MDRGVKGRLLITLILALLAIALLYPPSNKVIKTEEILQVPAITAGKDGIANTAAREGSDDEQVTEPGDKVASGDVVILPGPDGTLQTIQNRDAKGKLGEGDDVRISQQPPETVHSTLLARWPLSWLYLRGATKEEKLTEEKWDGSLRKTKIINYIATGRIRLGLDLRGGSELLYRIKTEDLSDSEKRGITDDTIAILRKRIDPQGVKEIRIQEQGAHRILIQLPGMTQKEVASVKRVIETVGKLDFYLVNGDPDKRSKVAQGRRIKGFVKKPVKGDPKGTWYLVPENPDISGMSVIAYPSQDKNGLPAVGFEFKENAGKKQFARLTGKNIGKQLAIVLDDELYSAPVIRSRIAGSGVIEGNFTQEEVADLVTVLKAGSLRADVVLEMESSVGPSLGEDSIRRGIWAILIGVILIGIVMVVYYFGAGLVANVALVLNLLWIMGIVALFRAALTLPGIAGLILTVGMAVDANVLIFERIREEKEKGKSLKLAINDGYDRALTTIVDANLTTLITAIILLLIGTGPVRGFGITLSVGIISSMFAALFVTRTIFRFLTSMNIVTEFSMSAFLTKLSHYLQRVHFSFLRLRMLAGATSGALIIVGLVTFGIRTIDNKIYDIDFSGGGLFHFALKPGLTLDYVRKKIEGSGKGYKDFELQSGSRDGSAAQEESASEFTLRLKHLTPEQCNDIVKSDLTAMLRDNNLYVEDVRILAPGERKAARLWPKLSCFQVATSRPISEKKLRCVEIGSGLLQEAGYFKNDVVSILAPGVRSSRFALSLRGAHTTDTRKEAREKIKELLGDQIRVLKDVTYTFGNLKPSSTGSRLTLAMDIGTPIDVEVIEDRLKEYLRQNGLAGSSTVVEGRGSDVNSLSAKKVRITGSEEVLKHLKEKAEKAKVLDRVPAVFFTDENILELMLEQPVTEDELYDKISSVQSGKAHIRDLDIALLSILPLDAPNARTFEIAMAPLSENRKQEKVKKDLADVFKEDTPTEQIDVTFAEIKPESSAEDVKQSERQTKTANLKEEQGKNEGENGTETADSRNNEPDGGVKTEEKKDDSEANKDAGNTEKPRTDEGKPSPKSPPTQPDILAIKMHIGEDMLLSEIKSRLKTAGALDYLAEEHKNQRGTSAMRDVTLNLPRGKQDQTETAIRKAFKEPHLFKRIETIGPVVAGEMKEKAYLALGLALFAIVFYIRVRFNEWRFGFAAIIALAHDVLVAIGAIAIADWMSESQFFGHLANILMFSNIKISLPVIAAFLTIIGYSLNDTIVVFDRIRENMGTKRRHLDEAVLDLSINQTLSRTLLTSITTFVVVLSLYILGGSVIHGFAFALLVGVVVGTYSSIFIASPVLAEWERVSAILLFPMRIIFFLLRLLMWPLTRVQSRSRQRSSSGKRSRKRASART